MSFPVQVPSLSVTHHSLSHRNGVQAIKQKALLKQVSLEADQDILNSIHLETDSLVPNVERFPSKINFSNLDTANAWIHFFYPFFYVKFQFKTKNLINRFYYKLLYMIIVL